MNSAKTGNGESGMTRDHSDVGFARAKAASKWCKPPMWRMSGAKHSCYKSQPFRHRDGLELLMSSLPVQISWFDHLRAALLKLRSSKRKASPPIGSAEWSAQRLPMLGEGQKQSSNR